jgi:maleylpyruvate isomerase
MRPDDHIAGAEAAHRRLEATVARLTASDLRAPSLLPDWNVAMVLTHLARNADSLRRMLEGARAGEVRDQYELGPAGRAADIEAGRHRELAFVVDDLRVANGLLEETWAALDDRTWAIGEGRFTSGEITPVRALPSRRWAEVEIHHRDVGRGYSESDWPAAFVALELHRALDGVPDRLTAADRSAWLAWLIGRRPPPDLDTLGPWQPPRPASP